MAYKLFQKELGRRLQIQREKMNLTQNQLVEKINKGLVKSDDDYLSDKQISRVECGESATRLDKFVRWSLALGKTPDYFLLNIDYENNSTEGKIFQINACLKNCTDDEIDTILILVQGMNLKKDRFDK